MCQSANSSSLVGKKIVFASGFMHMYNYAHTLHGDCCDHAPMLAFCNFCHKLGHYLESPIKNPGLFVSYDVHQHATKSWVLQAVYQVKFWLDYFP